MKYESEFWADVFQVQASNFYMEPLSKVICSGTSRYPNLGDATVDGTGAGHASRGGGCKSLAVLLTHCRTIPHVDALQIYSCGKHYEIRRNCL